MLAAAGILLGAAALLLVQLTMPQPGGAPTPAAEAKREPSASPQTASGSPTPDRIEAKPPSADLAPPPSPSDATATEESAGPIATETPEATGAVPAPPKTPAPDKTGALPSQAAPATPAETATIETPAPRTEPAPPAPSRQIEMVAREEAPPMPAPEVSKPVAGPVEAARPAPEPEPVDTAALAPEAASEPEPAEVDVTEAAPRIASREAPPAPSPRVAERAKETTSQAQSKPKLKPMTLGSAKEPIKPDKPSVSAGAYAGKVHSAIARNRRGIKGATGSATVTFTIGPAGFIRGARVSRSSGKQALDQAALSSVRGAAPFPAPPPGAKSTYSIQIYFR